MQFWLYNFHSALIATSARQGRLYVNVDFPNIIAWRVIAKVNRNVKHWMRWCECHYAVFWWKIWIRSKILTLENCQKTGGLCLWSGMKIKVHYESRNLKYFSASFYCMYSFNIVRHHIIFIFNTKGPIILLCFCFGEVLQKSLKS